MNSSARSFDLSALAARLPIVLLTVLTSCLFSLLVILQNPLLNDDAYKYLRAAEVFNAEGARTVLESFEWFHYSLLIAWVDRVLPGGLIVAAHTLNTAFYALLAYAFLLVSKELRDTPRAQLFAALCILALPLINEMRYFLIRDTGFWAFALLSLVYLIRYHRTGDMQLAFRWSIALVAASAFRLEGLLLLTLAPWSLLLPDQSLSMHQRATRCGRLVGVAAAVAVSILLLALLAGFSLPELITYAYRWYLPLLGNLPQVLTDTAGNVGAALFTPDNFPGSDNTAIGLIIALFGYVLTLLMNLVNALGLVLAILLVCGALMWGRPVQPQSGQRALISYMAITTLALLLFLLIMHFTTERYATLLALLVLTQVPLLLDDLYARAQTSHRLRQFHLYFFFFVFAHLVDSLVSFGYSHKHIEDGIAWTRAQLPAAAQMKTNNFALAYHSGRITDYENTSRDPADAVTASNPGDYLVLEVDSDANVPLLDVNPLLILVTSFANERGDEVRVYLRR